jgi:hypothetical protein
MNPVYCILFFLRVLRGSVLDFCHLNFEFVSDLDIRISDLQ